MRTYVAVVGLRQVWHNDFRVSFGSHRPRVQESFLIGHTSTARTKRGNPLDLYTNILLFISIFQLLVHFSLRQGYIAVQAFALDLHKALPLPKV